MSRPRTSLAKVLLVALAALPLEVLHYSILLIRYNAVPWAHSLGDVYLRVLLASLPLALIRFVGIGAVAWLILRLVGVRIDSREAISEAAWANPAVAAVLLALTPLAPPAAAEPGNVVSYMSLCYSAAIAASWVAPSYRVARILPRGGAARRPRDSLAAIIAFAVASFIVHLFGLTPASSVYSLVYYTVAPAQQQS